uniref:Tail assembly chaperone n=1 Tax=Micrococcus phage Kurnik TaxID=3092208 RepID=A0AAU6R6W6_9CAUD
MSRQIDVTKPLTEDEVEYLRARDRQDVLDQNALHLMGGGADEAVVEADSVEEPAAPQEPQTTGEPAEEVIEETTVVVQEEEEVVVPEGDQTTPFSTPDE